MSAEPLLEACGVGKTYGGTPVLSDVDFPMRRGRIHALIGENGAGKSTLLKILSGVEQPSAGMLRLDGRPARLSSAHDAAVQGIGMIHQELPLFPDLSVTDNLFAGRERRTRWGTLARADQEEAARGVLARLGQAIPPGEPLGDLPLGQRQIVAIARAVAHDVRVLLMDEPTSALTPSEIPTLFRLIRELAASGVAVAYVSHRLEELLAIADRVTVLRDGRVVGDAEAADVDVAWIVGRMTGRDAAAAGTAAPLAAGPPLLSVSGLALPARPGRTPLHAIALEVRAGEILGLYGLMGAGRSELLESLMGAHADAAGRVALEGRDLAGLGVGARVAAGLALVPEDRQAAGLVPTLSVRDNVTLSSLARLAVRGLLAPARESAAARPWIERLRVRAPGLEAPVGALSGGNQQKLVIARAAMSRPRVLLLDEPTRGVDVGARAEIVESMRGLAAEGLGIVFASSDLAEIRAAAARVLVLSRGHVTAELTGPEITDEALAAAASTAPAIAHEPAHA